MKVCVTCCQPGLSCRRSRKIKTRMNQKSGNKLKQHTRKFYEAYNKYDAAAVAALYTQDAVLARHRCQAIFLQAVGD